MHIAGQRVRAGPSSAPSPAPLRTRASWRVRRSIPRGRLRRPPRLRRVRPRPFLLACDGITDPGNLGALLRTAECAGVTGVLLPRHRAVHVTPAVTKAAAGAIEHLRFAIVGGLPAALARADELGRPGDRPRHGRRRVRSTPSRRSIARSSSWSAPRAGASGRLARERCEVVASVPMAGATESLNVSVAGRPRPLRGRASPRVDVPDRVIGLSAR